MVYFWLIPALLLLLALMWGLYGTATKHKTARGRSSGRILVDKPTSTEPNPH